MTKQGEEEEDASQDNSGRLASKHTFGERQIRLLRTLKLINKTNRKYKTKTKKRKKKKK